MSIASKFGGSSLADAAQIRKVAAIIRSDPRRRYIVLSAPGKRGRDDVKVTDLLYRSQALAQQGDLFRAAEVYDLLRRRFLEIASELGVSGMDGWLSEVETGIAGGADRDWVASRGEYLNAHLVAAFLGATFVDAADTIQFGSDGRFLTHQTYTTLGEALSGAGLFVVPGFYGRECLGGRIRCFSRGGSDVTGAIVARAVHAEVYENWTDVSGLLMADPRIISGPRSITEVTYREQREMSYRGATVLHDEAVFPVLEAGIPIHIRNTNDPDAPGTRVVTRRDTRRNPVIGIAGRTGFSTVLVEKTMMNSEVGYGRRILETLETHGISYEHAPTSIDTISVIVRDEEIAGKESDILDELRATLKPDRAEIRGGYALIAIVGEGMAGQTGIAARLLLALADAGVNVRMINQGVSEINIIVGVASADYDRAMRATHGAVMALDHLRLPSPQGDVLSRPRSPQRRAV